jgi:hypothetical protein
LEWQEEVEEVLKADGEVHRIPAGIAVVKIVKMLPHLPGARDSPTEPKKCTALGCANTENLKPSLNISIF